MVDNLSSLPRAFAVYGSLRVGEVSNYFMEDLEYVGQREIRGDLFNLGWYPGVLAGKHNVGTVVVDVYRAPDDDEEFKEVLERLDRYEGYNPNNPNESLFVRKEGVTINGERERVIFYEYNFDPKGERIPSGDWQNRDAGRIRETMGRIRAS